MAATGPTKARDVVQIKDGHKRCRSNQDGATLDCFLSKQSTTFGLVVLDGKEPRGQFAVHSPWSIEIWEHLQMVGIQKSTSFCVTTVTKLESSDSAEAAHLEPSVLDPAV